LHHYEYCMVFFEKGFIQIAAGTCFHILTALQEFETRL
jgi:hypothetical protein